MAAHVASASADVLALPSDASVDKDVPSALDDASLAVTSAADAPVTVASTQSDRPAPSVPAAEVDFVDLMRTAAGLTLHEFQTVTEVVFAEAAAFQAVCFADMKQFADDDT